MQLDHQDIVIIGDSYCRNRDEESDWPKVVHDSLVPSTHSSQIVRGHGYGGCAWWSVRKRLYKELEIHIPKLLILCHTDYNRLANDEDIPLTVNFSRGPAKLQLAQQQHNAQIKVSSPEFYKAVEYYYRHLHIKDHHQWAQQAWFKELDTLLSEFKEMQVIHIHCFQTNGHYQFNTGITISEDLFNIHTAAADGGRNHFSKEQNQQIGNRLVELVRNYTPGLQSLNIK